MRKILITGITGFVGSHLAEAYLKKGCQVFGTYKTNCHANENDNIKQIENDIILYNCDLVDRNSVYRVIGLANPDIIHHLAAQSFVKSSWDNPEYTLINNIISELNVLEVCRQLGIDPVIHVAGSSEEYGRQDKMPINEDAPLRPLSPYAVSKVGQDMLAQQYHASYGTKTVITRAFNHEGPRRGQQFVTSTFAFQAAKIKQRERFLKNFIGKRKNEISVGNLDAIRDYTDITDMVMAYMMAVEKCEYGTPYNIASGVGHRIKEILDHYVNNQLKDIKIDVDIDESRMRPSDLPELVGDSTKFRKATGWKPTVSFEEMLDRIYDYWAKKIN